MGGDWSDGVEEEERGDKGIAWVIGEVVCGIRVMWGRTESEVIRGGLTCG